MPDLSEERMARNLKAVFGEFVATGAPTTSLNWRPFTGDNNVFYEMENGVTGRNFRSEKAFRFWHNYLPKLAEQLQLGNLFPVTIGERQKIVTQEFFFALHK
jgi:hypothetical protein